jgi:hypothetical protein
VLVQFIKTVYDGEIILNCNDIISPKHLDIYLPDLKIAFEFNGLYWHNELFKNSTYHKDKTDKCLEMGIKLIHIWEDDWIYKNDIIKSRIRNILNQNTKKIYARKCVIKEVTASDSRIFLNQNHLQGFINSKYYIALFHDNEMVSIMTFGQLRNVLGVKNKKNHFELYRFCNKLNMNVVGGASKLFNYFITKYSPDEVISYFDRSWGYSKVYNTIGFKLDSYTIPNYYYVISGIRQHRFNWNKQKLIKMGYDKNKTEKDIMLENKNYRIYNSGNEKWVWKTSI